MSNKIKSFITGTVMSLSRLNQLKGRDNDLLSVEDDTFQEQKIRKQEINIISEKRFYDLLDAADRFHKNKNVERFQQILENRGISNDFISFKNQTYEPPMHEQLSGVGEYTYKFKTDNDICKYSSDVHIKNENGVLTLSFLINLQQYPIVRKIGYDLKNLTAFALNENAKVYAYEITNFIGIVRPNENEIYIVFEGRCELNGEYVREMSTQDRTMKKDDLIDPKTYFLHK